MTDPIRNVLFVCTHNSARSILAEGLLNGLAGGRFRGYSAGSQPKAAPNPLALETLSRLQMPADGYRSKDWDEFARPGAPRLDFIFTVCDSAAAESCPVWVGAAGGQPVKVHWGYPDPSNAEGGDEGKRRAFELTRQAIAYRMLQLLQLPLAQMDRPSLQASLQAIGQS